MGLFSGISNASKTGGRNPFISKPGTLLVEVLRYRSGENRARKPFAQIDIKVLYSLGPAALSADVEEWLADNPKKADAIRGEHKPGERLACRTAVDPGDLRNVHLGEIRAFTEGIVESMVDGDWEAFTEQFGIPYDPTDGFDDDGLEAVIEGLSDGDGTDCAGALLVVTSDSRISVRNKAHYIVSGFTCGNAVARELAEKGEIDLPGILQDDED